MIEETVRLAKAIKVHDSAIVIYYGSTTLLIYNPNVFDKEVIIKLIKNAGYSIEYYE